MKVNDMKNHRQRLIAPLFLSALMLALISLGGCTPPKPSERAVEYYFRAAALGEKAHVRRLWPKAQTYADDVMAAQRKLAAEYAAMDDLQLPESLWVKIDPRWHDAKALDKEIKRLNKWLKGGEPAREEHGSALEKAIDAVPESVIQVADGGKDAFIEKVKRILDYPPSGDVEALVTERIELFRAAHEAVVGGEGEEPMTVSPLVDGEVAANVSAARRTAIEKARSLYSSVEDELLASRRAQLDQHSKELTDVLAKVDQLNARKDRFRYQYAVDRRATLKDDIKQIAKSLHELSESKKETRDDLEDDLADAKDDKERQTLQEKIDATKAEEERAKARLEVLQPQVDDVLAAADK